MARKNAPEGNELAEERYEMLVEYQHGSPALYYRQEDLYLEPDLQIRFQAEGKIHPADEAGELLREETGELKIETIHLDKVGRIKETVAGPVIRCGHTPEWELCNGEPVQVWGIREWRA